MPLSWNEIRSRALTFSREWRGETRERAEAKSFWDGFFRVFGTERRVVASFEAPVRALDKRSYGYIDLLWKGILLVEHKSAGKSLERAQTQAFDYIQALHAAGRGHEAPRYILVSDFARVTLYDLDEDTSTNFALDDLHKNVHAFSFIAGYRAARLDRDSPANIKAAEIMAVLHDSLADGGYAGGDVDRLLTRILFCLFAEDTGIFEPNAFTSFIENRTAPDGSDLGARLAEFFQTLNTPVPARQRRLDEALTSLPYVNGALFEGFTTLAAFDSNMRAKLLDCAHFDWSSISPAIFGSIFQGVMDPPERRQLGAHYTGEGDIMKVLRDLFLEDLKQEIAAAKQLKIGRRQRMGQIHDRIARLRFLDPACGCGNFLILAYRELRRLEQDILVNVLERAQVLDIALLNRVSISQFHGIELLEFPAEIARVGMWLMEHQMNMSLSEALGLYFVRLPLSGSAPIVCGNALQLPWAAAVPPSDDVLVLGNPPFVGKKEQSPAQKLDMRATWGALPGAGVLDYVTCWYRKAADYIAGTRIRCAFVSTSSITQGEQVGVLWRYLLAERKIAIQFAHRTFSWTSEARGKAHVHVVIIGFGAFETTSKCVYDYDGAADEGVHVVKVKRINPYLVDAPDIYLTSRASQISGAPEVSYGSFALDDGHFTLTTDERDEILAENRGAAKFLPAFIGGKELIHGEQRWCVWLKEAPPAQIRKLGAIARRVEAVRKWRASRDRAATQALAETPTLFAEIRQPTTRYLAFPTLSSEHRRYIPIAFLDPGVIASNQIYVIPDATPYHFGVLTSSMHMAWIRTVCGRLESRYRYSAKIVYNNFPWPPAPSEAATTAVARAAEAVLDARGQFPDHSLADLYDSVSMPPVLARAHAQLDRAVERCYRKEPFRKGDRERVEHLFQLYEELVQADAAPAAPRRRGRT